MSPAFLAGPVPRRLGRFLSVSESANQNHHPLCRKQSGEFVRCIDHFPKHGASTGFSGEPTWTFKVPDSTMNTCSFLAPGDKSSSPFFRSCLSQRLLLFDRWNCYAKNLELITTRPQYCCKSILSCVTRCQHLARCAQVRTPCDRHRTVADSANQCSAMRQ